MFCIKSSKLSLNYNHHNFQFDRNTDFSQKILSWAHHEFFTPTPPMHLATHLALILPYKNSASTHIPHIICNISWHVIYIYFKFELRGARKDTWEIQIESIFNQSFLLLAHQMLHNIRHICNWFIKSNVFNRYHPSAISS